MSETTVQRDGFHPVSSRCRGISGGFWFLVGDLLTAGAATVLLWKLSGENSRSSPVNVSQPTVVHQIQQLERLETIVYRMEKIISGGRESRYLPQFLAGERLLLVVHGEVIAGIDLSKVLPEHVVIRGQMIELTLPKAEVFTTRVDNERSRVYSRETGLFTRVDPHLETEVRQEAERQLLQAALDDDILQTAEQNARTTLTSLLKGFGFEQAEVR